MTRLKTLLFTTALFLGSFGYAQISIDPANGDWESATTEEEYNYLTKGYAIQVESGLDMKRGYSMLDLGETPVQFSTGIRRAQFLGLMRDGATRPCAILMIYKSPSNDLTYLCIPTYNANPELWQKTMNQVTDLTSSIKNSSMTATMLLGLMHLSTSLATQSGK